MNTFSKGKKWSSYSWLLMICTTLILLVSNSIHSQTTTNTNEPSFFSETRNIEYGRLNEIKKAVDHLELLKKRDSLQQIQIRELDSTVSSIRAALEYVNQKVIPSYERELDKWSAIDKERQAKAAIAQDLSKLEINAIRSKRFSLGPYIGYGYASDGVGGPSAGICLNLTLFRF